MLAAPLGGGTEVLFRGEQQLARRIARVGRGRVGADRTDRVVLEAAGLVVGDRSRNATAAVGDRIERRGRADHVLVAGRGAALGPVAARAAVAGDPGDAHGVDVDVMRVGGHAVAPEQVDRVERVADRVVRVGEIGRR